MFTLFLTQRYWIDILAIILALGAGWYGVGVWAQSTLKNALQHNERLTKMRYEIYEKYEKNFFAS